jgi:hypothetical protein
VSAWRSLFEGEARALCCWGALAAVNRVVHAQANREDLDLMTKVNYAIHYAKCLWPVVGHMGGIGMDAE